jgi:nucleoside 2-deoxyribosyltransferase
MDKFYWEMTIKKKRPMVYLIGSLRNPDIIPIHNYLEAIGFKPFSDWHSAGPEADDYWKKDQQEKGLTYKEALNGPAAQHVFQFDKKHLDMSDMAVLVMPAGKSGCLELGYIIGNGKPGFVLFDKEPEQDRWDVMLAFADDIFFSKEELGGELVGRYLG